MNQRANRRLAGGLIALAAGLAVNSLLGPLVANVITYPLSEPVMNQILGVEAVSLLIVAPMSILAAVLVLRGNANGPMIAISTAAYTAYMFVQYIIGPQYVNYSPAILLHLVLFILGGILAVESWNRIRINELPTISPHRKRIYSGGLVLLALFASFSYIFAVPQILAGGTIPAEYTGDPSVYWTIFLMDLGIVVPISVAVGIGLLRGREWARKAIFGFLEWFALVSIAILAMFVSMQVNNDPNVTVGLVAVLSIATLLITAFAIWGYLPYFRHTIPN